ncbi:EAL domain-containing protein [Sphingomonas sp.]|uniref:EAL domain-containing protein n=1 Tax=Sphingomonas sp. TaxID=28214 RepID=UPI000DB692F9|nr:EAL domain-containing protein [Sphingomonas sp.]PZU09644.1 MAG: diguanylate cyclase [Sphingomonas sp.]
MNRSPTVLDRITRYRSLERNSGRRAEDQDGSQRALRLVQAIEDQGNGWFWETDRAGHITYLSAKIADFFGGEGAVLGESLKGLFQTSGSGMGTERTLGFLLQAHSSFSDLEIVAGAVPGRVWSISGRPALDRNGRFMGFVGTGSDLTARQRTEAEITRLALYDTLTGLANRARLQHGLDQALARRSGGGRRTALFQLDLDRFKAVNDTLGHQVGDQLLVQVARRLQAAAENMPSALVGRLGGDEFQIVIVGDHDREELAVWAKSIIASLARPYSIKDAWISIGSSIGIALAPDDGDDPETLVRNADLALYAAKGAGRGVFHFFKADLLAQARRRKEMEDDLRDALRHEQLRLVYQPIVSTLSGEVTGFEALLRWQHPKRGPVSPADFIPVAEESGLIEQIGEWVLRTAAREAVAWPRPVRLAVNVSPVQFAKPGWPAVVANALAVSGLEARRLELEITESVFMEGSDTIQATFKALKRLGIRFALDDFGTSYSSLGYLQTAPFDKIKIDQSFVRGACIAGSRNGAIIRAIVGLAEALELETTAEGVEAHDEIELIRSLGCSHIQGFVYGMPMTHDAVMDRLANSTTLVPSGVRHSRPPRVRMLRSVMIEQNGKRTSARLRDISVAGAMIDQLGPAGLLPGATLQIELMAGDWTPARVQWSNDGRAGLSLLRSFNFAAVTGQANGTKAAG